MENPSRGLMWMNSSSSPLNNSDKIFAKAAAESGPLRLQRVASSSPLKHHMYMVGEVSKKGS